MSKEATNQFEQEKGRVNSNHDLDAGALGPGHLGSHRGGRGEGRQRRAQWRGSECAIRPLERFVDANRADSR